MFLNIRVGIQTISYTQGCPRQGGANSENFENSGRGELIGYNRQFFADLLINIDFFKTEILLRLFLKMFSKQSFSASIFKF
jgi:hypothetical protein